mmetsp:Transcript_22930/g.53517  ORF Transcript_22930/g.53517 Transcript_22930/m.53517 type:complete len:897 (+) Transcript_22930:39-2729(+)
MSATKPAPGETSQGFGIVFTAIGDQLVISSVNPNGPADKCGVERGDVLSGINGTSTEGLTVEQAAQLCRSSSVVVLSLKKPGSETANDVTVTRGTIPSTPVGDPKTEFPAPNAGDAPSSPAKHSSPEAVAPSSASESAPGVSSESAPQDAPPSVGAAPPAPTSAAPKPALHNSHGLPAVISAAAFSSLGSSSMSVPYRSAVSPPSSVVASRDHFYPPSASHSVSSSVSGHPQSATANPLSRMPRNTSEFSRDEDIRMVMNSVGVSRNEATEALQDSNNDPVEAIMRLHRRGGKASSAVHVYRNPNSSIPRASDASLRPSSQLESFLSRLNASEHDGRAGLPDAAAHSHQLAHQRELEIAQAIAKTTHDQVEAQAHSHQLAHQSELQLADRIAHQVSHTPTRQEQAESLARKQHTQEAQLKLLHLQQQQQQDSVYSQHLNQQQQPASASAPAPARTMDKDAEIARLTEMLTAVKDNAKVAAQWMGSQIRDLEAKNAELTRHQFAPQASASTLEAALQRGRQEGAEAVKLAHLARDQAIRDADLSRREAHALLQQVQSLRQQVGDNLTRDQQLRALNEELLLADRRRSEMERAKNFAQAEVSRLEGAMRQMRANFEMQLAEKDKALQEARSSLAQETTVEAQQEEALKAQAATLSEAHARHLLEKDRELAELRLIISKETEEIQELRRLLAKETETEASQQQALGATALQLQAKDRELDKLKELLALRGHSDEENRLAEIELGMMHMREAHDAMMMAKDSEIAELRRALHNHVDDSRRISDLTRENVTLQADLHRLKRAEHSDLVAVLEQEVMHLRATLSAKDERLALLTATRSMSPSLLPTRSSPATDARGGKPMTSPDHSRTQSPFRPNGSPAAASSRSALSPERAVSPLRQFFAL